MSKQDDNLIYEAFRTVNEVAAVPPAQQKNAGQGNKAAPAAPAGNAPAQAANDGQNLDDVPTGQGEHPDAEGQPAAAAPQSGATPQGGQAAATQNPANAGTAQTNQANPNAAAGQAAQPQDPQQLMSIAGQALDTMAKNPQHAVLLLQQVLKDQQAKQALIDDPEIQQWLVQWMSQGGQVNQGAKAPAKPSAAGHDDAVAQYWNQ